MSKHLPSKNCVEILCIGTELLLGDIINSNARWIARELAVLGLPHYRQTVVGDNIDRLKQSVLESAERSRILITTGGLGPTPDDLTIEAIASAFKAPLQEKKKVWLDIQEKTLCIEQPRALSNRKQALLPIQAEIIPNPSGTAPGMIWQPIEGFTILSFPGVPSELKEMWKESALPWLKKNGGSKQTLVSRVLKISGIPESILAEKIEDLLNQQNPTIAPYANLGEVKLRLTARSNSCIEGEKLLVPLEKELLHRIGLKCYGSGDETLSSVVIELLRKRQETFAVAESCTGGGIGSAVTSLAGASDVFLGGVIAYSNAVKEKVLGVQPELIKKYGAVSEQVVEAMAIGARNKLNADWVIAISGLAGPDGGTELKPVGTVHIAIAGPQGCKSILKKYGSHRQRTEIQKLSVLCGLDQLRLLLLSRS